MKKINKQITLGRDANGKRIIKWIHADSVQDFERQKFELKKQHEAIRNPSNVTFLDYSKQWLETYKSNKSINTYSMYKHALNKCISLNPIRVKDIVHSNVQAVISSYADHPRLCQQIALTLKQIFAVACKDGIILINPALDVELPKYRPKEKTVLTEQQRKIIREVDLQPQDRLFLDLLYYFGLRRGEALALTRSDFDFTALLLTVNKSIAFDGNNATVKATKTQVRRYVPIPEAIAPKLKKALSKCDFIIFQTENGQQITLSGFRRMWDRIQKSVNKAAGGNGSFKAFTLTPHMLRHDYATRLYYVPGISTKKKADILGHSERLFLELYSHLDDKKEDLQTFQKLMNF